MPLARNEFRGNIVISYDFNHFTPITSWGANFYWGAGDDYNLGFGYQPPIGISHLTAVKYFISTDSKYENLYASLNGVFLNSDYSPNLEIGASYFIKSGSSIHSFSAGMWILFDNEAAEPFWKMLFLPGSVKARIKLGLHPFIRYEYSYKDFNFSLRNNIGLTNRVVNGDRKYLEQRNAIILPNFDIEYVTFNAVTNGIQIQLKDSTTYRISSNYPQIDRLAPDMRHYRLKRFDIADSLDYYYVISLRPDQNSPGNREIMESSLYELNFDAIWLDYADKKDIVIGSHPELTRKMLSKIHWYKHDWSLGVGVKIKQ
jgi:hypothetical protein